MTPSRLDIFAFGEKVLALLEEGSFTATYKYAVLLALIDLCMEQAEADGEAPHSIGTRDLAEKIIEIYWPHTREFAGASRAKVLRQNAGGQAEIVQAIRRHRERQGSDPTEPLARTRRRAPQAFVGPTCTPFTSIVESTSGRASAIRSSSSQAFYVRSYNGDGLRWFRV